MKGYYVLVTDEPSSEFVSQAEALIDDGYIPLGGPISHGGKIVQAFLSLSARAKTLQLEEEAGFTVASRIGG